MTQEQEARGLASAAAHFFRAQLFGSLPYPTRTFDGQTVIVTGSNVGMGLEAARHFVRLNAAKVILAVRSLSKGQAAAKSIISSTGRDPSVVEVWELDLASYGSVKRFAKRVEKKLDRLDVAVLNAGVYLFDFEMAEQDERTITVNVVSTMLLGILLLPKLRETSVREDKECVLTVNGSFVHYMTSFPERKAERIFEELAVKERARMGDRYNVSKLMQLLLIRELASQATSSTKLGNIVISIITPGYVATSIMRDAGVGLKAFMAVWGPIAARTAEEGGRTLVFAAYGGKETHGMYLDDCKVGKVSPFVVGEDGKRTQKKLWKELGEKLEKIEPGVMALI